MLMFIHQLLTNNKTMDKRLYTYILVLLFNNNLFQNKKFIFDNLR